MKRKTTIIYGIAVLILLAAPISFLLSHASASQTEVAAVSHFPCTIVPGCEGDRGCFGDTMSYTGCKLYCTTGNTTSDPVPCTAKADEQQVENR